ncbi:armadillo-type protein [Ephemerocybe angulata]|uniref:Armadillo-type protein n=1 Tax=Ephemerocybe angulata TaxID=980116 RepID=A0A8H6IH82_9AGAR|nr:armadillo-type protein [Tulosesus angulatus]
MPFGRRILKTPPRLKPGDEENAGVVASENPSEGSTGFSKDGLDEPNPEAQDPKARSFRHDAKIWHVYLEDAEKEAREQAELWRTGLESLLIFAGLFAAVVASFLIDSKKDLQSDSEQRMLYDIRASTRPVGVAYQVPTYTDTVNGLWVISLYLTLFSAIMGVLAKAWIAKYIPATTRHEASDAASRFMLDQQARSWYIQEVITLVPLLVQIATFLFLIGLFLQILDDNKKLGFTLMAFCISGGVVYVVITGTHLLSRTAPVNTPLSELLLVQLHQTTPDDGFHAQTLGDKDEVLAHILYAKLIRSPKHSSLDAAIEEVATKGLDEKWAKMLCQTKTPEIIASRLHRCVTTGTQDKERRHANISNQLMVLLWFAQLYEMDAKTPGVSYGTLDAALRSLLQPGFPLHRLNGVDSVHRPLLFTLCTNVLIILQSLEGSKAPMGVHGELEHFDLEVHELLDHPWEMALQRIDSEHRIGFMLAACRGAIKGRKVLKMTSAFILGLSFARAASRNIESGGGTEWDPSITKHDRNDAEELALLFICEAYRASIESFETMPVDLMRNSFSTWGVVEEVAQVEVALYDLPALSTIALPYLTGASRAHVEVVVVDILAVQCAGFNASTLKALAQCAAFGGDEVRHKWLRALTQLWDKFRVETTDGKLSQMIVDVLASTLQSGLETEARHSGTVKLIRDLYDSRNTSPLYPAVTKIVSHLVKVDPHLAEPYVQSLSEAERERERNTVLRSFRSALKGGTENRLSVLNPLASLLSSRGLGDKHKYLTFAWNDHEHFIVDVCNQLLAEIVDLEHVFDSTDVYLVTSDFLKSLVEETRLHGKLAPHILDASWCSELTEPNRPHAMFLIAKFFALCMDFTTCPSPTYKSPILRQLVQMALAKSLRVRPGVGQICANAITLILRKDVHSQHVQVISETILEHTNESSSARFTTPTEVIIRFSVLCKVASRVDLPGVIPRTLEAAVYWVREGGEGAIDAISHFFRNVERTTYYGALNQAIIPELKAFVPMGDKDYTINSRWIRLLAVLSDQSKPELREIARNMLQDVFPENALDTPQPLHRYWKNLTAGERVYWFETYCLLAKNIPEDFSRLLHVILQCWQHEEDFLVRGACFHAIHLLLETDENEWDEAVAKLVNLASNDSDPEVRYKAYSSLLILGKSEKPYAKKLWSLFKQNLISSMKDNDTRIRRLCLQFVPSTISIADHSLLAVICEATIKDEDRTLRVEALGHIQTYLATLAAGHKRFVVSHLSSILIEALRGPAHYGRVISVLSTLGPDDILDKDKNTKRVVGVQLLCFLGQWKAFKPLQSLIEKIIMNSRNEVEESIQPRGLHFEACQLALYEGLTSALKNQVNIHTRTAAVILFGKLLGSTDYESLLINEQDGAHNSDQIIIRRLAEICIDDGDTDLRHHALSSLKSAYEKAYWSKLIKKDLGRIMEEALAGPISANAHANAVSVIHDLVREDTGKRMYEDLLSPAIPRLMTVLVTDEDHPLKDVVKDIFLGKLSSSLADDKLNGDVWRAVTTSITQATGGNDTKSLETLAYTLPLSNGMAIWVTNMLASKLSHAPHSARSAIIGVLSILHSKYGFKMPELLRSATAGLIWVTLDDKENSRTRKGAILLLARLCHSSESAFEDLSASALQFVQLLENRELRSHIVEILSVICRDSRVRQSLLHPVISLSVDVDNQFPVGIVEFITRLISDGV